MEWNCMATIYCPMDICYSHRYLEKKVEKIANTIKYKATFLTPLLPLQPLPLPTFPTTLTTTIATHVIAITVQVITLTSSPETRTFVAAVIHDDHIMPMEIDSPRPRCNAPLPTPPPQPTSKPRHHVSWPRA